jgi:hypothetical protein
VRGEMQYDGRERIRHYKEQLRIFFIPFMDTLCCCAVEIPSFLPYF